MIKKQIKALIAAFSMYSKIPMPRVEWEDDTLKYALLYFPLVGLVIGAAVYFAMDNFFCGEIPTACIMTVLPIVITGGIHLDGLMDVSDALASYQSKEKKLEIMSDPHIGAFAAISLVCYILLYFGAWIYFIYDIRRLLCISMGFVLSRALSGLCLVLFPKAKKDGLAAMFANKADKNAVCVAMLLYIAAVLFGMYIVRGTRFPIFPFAFALITTLVYLYTAMKNFGGVTGDTAGWFLCWCELAIMVGCMIDDRFLFPHVYVQ